MFEAHTRCYFFFKFNPTSTKTTDMLMALKAV